MLCTAITCYANVMKSSTLHLELISEGMESRGGMESSYKIYTIYTEWLPIKSQTQQNTVLGPLGGPKRMFWIVCDLFRRPFCIYCKYIFYIFRTQIPSLPRFHPPCDYFEMQSRLEQIRTIGYGPIYLEGACTQSCFLIPLAASYQNMS